MDFEEIVRKNAPVATKTIEKPKAKRISKAKKKGEDTQQK